MQRKINLKQLSISLLSVLSITAFPSLFLYFQNSGEAKFGEILSPLLIFIVIGVILFTLSWAFTKDIYKASVIASIVNLIFLNYALIEKLFQKIFSMLNYWHIVLILIFAMAHVVWIIWKKSTHEFAQTATLVILLVFSGLILFNGVVAAPTIVKKVSLEKQRAKDKLNVNPNSSENNLPNIYYLIFDEYSSNSFMEKYFNYDNSEFTDYLEKLNFNVSYTSRNESIMTRVITANIVNLDYITTNDMPEVEVNNLRKNNFLFKYLGRKGYKISGTGYVQPYGLENAAMAGSYESNTLKGETVADLLFQKTVLWPFYISRTYTKAEENIISTFQYLKNPANIADGENFVFGHIICPHEPFYFDRYGGTYEKPSTDWKDLKYYLGQYIFVNNQIMEVVDSIVENDPDSIIILQSDHSARASSDTDLFLKVFSIGDMHNILNAVYYRGEKLDIEGLSGVNTLRAVLNGVFGENYDMLDVPADNFEY